MKQMKIDENRWKDKTNEKLSKLVITKLQGNYLDWLMFWNQFNAEIRISVLPAVSKFSCLKKLLIPKVKAFINGLSFNSEWYERASTTLKSVYEHPT